MGIEAQHQPCYEGANQLRIDGDVAVHLAAYVSYLDAMGLNGRVLKKSIRDNTGGRYMNDHGNRSVDLAEVLRLLDLSQNKYLVLRLLQRPDLIELLGLLDKDMLINGLMFFPREQLLNMMASLPKGLLIKMLLTLTSLERLVKQMPTHEIFNILKHHRVTEQVLINMFRAMAPYYMKHIQFILMKMTGKDTSKLTLPELLDSFRLFRKRQILEGMKMLPFKALQPFIFFLVQQDPELLKQLSLGFLFKIFEQYTKADLVESFRVVPDEMIIELLSQLPDMYLAMVVDQLDPNTLETYLLSQQSGLLYYLAEGTQAA